MSDIYDEMTPTPLMGQGWGWMMAYGILSVLIGAIAFWWPFPATMAATLVIGAFFVVGGIGALISGYGGKGHESRGYAIFFAILSIIVGILLWAMPMQGAISLTLVVAAWLGVRGVMEIVWGVRMRRHRAMMLILGIINVVLAALVIVTIPFSALTLPGYILGISFVVSGVNAVMWAMTHRGDRTRAAV